MPSNSAVACVIAQVAAARSIATSIDKRPCPNVSGFESETFLRHCPAVQSGLYGVNRAVLRPRRLEKPGGEPSSVPEPAIFRADMARQLRTRGDSMLWRPARHFNALAKGRGTKRITRRNDA